MNCPDCQGPMYDNTQSKRNPRSPDYRCKDKNCNKAVWNTKPDGAPSSNGNGNGNHAPTQSIARRPLGPLYNDCLTFAKAACLHHFGNDAAVSDIIAATATLFIQAVKDNAPIRALPVAAAPVAPPPPPPPAPVAVPAGYAQSNADPLPF